MEAILSNYDDDETTRQMEELIQANHELMESNEKLKAQLAEKTAQIDAVHLSGASLDGTPAGNQASNVDNLHAEMVIELNE